MLNSTLALLVQLCPFSWSFVCRGSRLSHSTGFNHFQHRYQI